MLATEILPKIYEAINHNNIPAALEYFDPSIVRVEPEGFPTSGTYKGLTEVGLHFTSARATWAEGSCDIETMETHRDKILAIVHVHVRLKDSKEWLTGRVADVWTFRNGLVTDFRSFLTEEKAQVFFKTDS